jgi:hypothetical protein
VNRGITVRVAEVVADWWPQLLTAIGFVLLALASLADSQDQVNLSVAEVPRTYIFGAGAALLVLGSIFMTLNGQERASLKSRVADLEGDNAALQNSLKRQGRNDLVQLGKQLRFFSSERISLFAVAKNSFHLVARHSPNPAYESQGRHDYPLDQGCLGRAWRESVASAELPDPNVDKQEWQQAQLKDHGIPLLVSQAFVMKSRTYVAFRIDRSGVKQPLGVVIFESELTAAGAASGQRIGRDDLEKIMKGVEGVRLQCMLESVQ